MTGRGLRRRDGESWLQAALRLAQRHGHERGVADEVADRYYRLVSVGVSDEEAALSAVLELDLAEILQDEQDNV